jgi:hypothetical protein
MDFKKSFTAFLIVFIAVTGFSQSAMAKDEAMICAVTKAVSCHKKSDCIQGTAADINMPLFMKINPKDEEIVSVKESGERRVSTIKHTAKDKDGRFLVYQGVEQGGAWSAVVDTTTGSLTASIAAGENDAYIIYGACSKSLLKP